MIVRFFLSCFGRHDLDFAAPTICVHIDFSKQPFVVIIAVQCCARTSLIYVPYNLGGSNSDSADVVSEVATPVTRHVRCV